MQDFTRKLTVVGDLFFLEKQPNVIFCIRSMCSYNRPVNFVQLNMVKFGFNSGVMPSHSSTKTMTIVTLRRAVPLKKARECSDDSL